MADQNIVVVQAAARGLVRAGNIDLDEFPVTGYDEAMLIVRAVPVVTRDRTFVVMSSLPGVVEAP
jgi:uncharacterized protein with ACT and thioredoxin-like domain